MAVKKSIEVQVDVAELLLRFHAVQGLQAPLLMASRRTAMGGLAASAAAAKASCNGLHGTVSDVAFSISSRLTPPKMRRGFR